ncbi:MAG: peptidylprolyl isomerase [Gammaproteobacteria bacterium]|nr:MAG: peptidylprolyl isomerase [Gammaproteobacteria bacterium]
MKEQLTVTPHKVITMQYSLSNTDGVIIREASGTPITYLHGVGALFTRLEQALESHRIGDIVTARLLPGDAFGKRDPDLVQEVPLSELPPGENIETGGKITGTDEQGNEMTFSVTEVKDGIACLDGNHPLAGQSLLFEVEIQGIRDATKEEIRTGKTK